MMEHNYSVQVVDAEGISKALIYTAVCYTKQGVIDAGAVASVISDVENIISDATEEVQTRENIETVANILEMSSNFDVNEEVYSS